MHDINAIRAAQREAICREYYQALKSDNLILAARIRAANTDFVTDQDYDSFIKSMKERHES